VSSTRAPGRPAAPTAPLPAAVLWDMDGTLVDTEPYWFAAERDLVDAYGDRDWPDEMAARMVGFDLLDGARFLQEHAHVDLPAEEIVDRLLDGVIARLHRSIPWQPGARELLADLNEAGVPCALVTMSWRRFVDPVLAALPEGSFVASITGDEIPYGEGKPHPTPYVLGAQACGADPRDCVAIEDSPTGTRSALAAGCRVLGVPNVTVLEPEPGMALVESLAEVRIGDLADLLAAEPEPPRRTRRLPPVRVPPVGRRTLIIALAVVTAVVAALVWWSNDDATERPEPPPGAVATDVWVPYWTLGDIEADGYERLEVAREISPFWFETLGVDDIGIDAQAQPDEIDAFLDAVGAGYIVPSIRDHMPAGGMAAILADPVQREQHINAILEFADEHDAEGIDLDYEKFAFEDGSDTWATTRPNWVAFVEELSVALHDTGRTLTVSIPGIWNRTDSGSEGYWVYDHGAIAEHVDAMRIMAYDYSVAEPGPIAPLTWVEDVVRSLSEEVPEEHHDKLVLGVPTYGVNWIVSTIGECPASADGRTGVTARGALELAERRGGVPELDPVVSEWSFTYALEFTEGDQSCVQNRLVRWVDSEGVEARVLVARYAGWGGVALWALGYDDPEVWAAFVDAARRDLTVAPSTPPTTSPAG
jgi:HAD superfamily hydrolase (TIGR01509 family)